MASMFLCSSCGKDNPELFVLSGSQKVPLCTTDIGTYIMKTSSLGCPIFPIAAIGFIEKASDQGLYQQRVEAMDKASLFVDGIVREEEEQWKAAMTRVITMKEDTLAEVRTGFEYVSQHLKELHEDFLTSVQGIKAEFEKTKLTKPLFLTPEATLLLQISQQAAETTPNFFNSAVKSVVRKVKRAVASCVSFKSIDILEFLNHTFHIGSPEPKPKPKKKIKQAKMCSTCGLPLSSNNFQELVGHENCEVCFACIEGGNNVRLRCPICKSKYCSEAKEVLKMKIPQLFAHPEKRERRKMGSIYCANCNTDMDRAVHICANGVQICLSCCQTRVIRDSLGKIAKCPECGGLFPREVFDAFDGELQNCSFCAKEVYLATVAHRCKGPKIALSCESCSEAHRRGNKCERCGGTLGPLKSWGVSSDTEEESS